MFLKMILTRCYNYIIKHLELSKCFFHAQKRDMYVYLEMGSNHPGVVCILIAGIFYLFIHEKLKQIA